MATVASLVVNLTANTSRLDKAFGRSQGIIKNFVKSTKSVTRQLDEVSRYGAKAGIGLAALTASTIALTKAAGNHEEAMLRVKAVSGATRAEYDQLSKSAIKLSTTTVHSLSGIEGAMKFLGVAGYKANEIIGLMPAIAKMATAGGVELSETANITSQILKGYAMGIEDVARVTDVLTMAMVSSNNDLKDLGEAFKHVGPVAESAGVEFETTAAIIAMLGDAGIKGSIAGTSLKSAITRLSAPSASAQRTLKKLGVETLTTTGELMSMEDIIGQLEKSGAKTGDMMRIFGMRAGPSMARLVTMGSDALSEYIEKLRQSEGIAAQIESEQMQSLNAQLELTRGQFGALSTEIGQDFLPVAKTVNYYVGDAVKWFRDLDDETKHNIYRIGLMTAAILGIVTAFGVVAGALSIIIKGFTVFGIILGLATSGPVLAILGIATAVGFLKAAWDENMGGIQEKTKFVMDKIQEYFWKLHTWWYGVPAVTPEGITSGFDEDQLGFEDTLVGIGRSINDSFFGAWDWIVNTTWEEKWEDVKAVLSEAWDWIKATSSGIWDGFVNLAPVQSGIDQVRAIYWSLYTWWNGTPAELGGLTSGFEENQLGFKDKLIGIKNSVINVWIDLKEETLGIWESIKTTTIEKWDEIVTSVTGSVNAVLDTLDMSLEEAIVSLGLVTVASIATWKLLPAVFPGLSIAITSGISALAAGGLALGKLSVASIILSLAAGSIGWAFGDKEGRDAFFEAVKASFNSMTMDDPITIPLGISDIMQLSFDFGSGGIEKLRQKIKVLHEELEKWEPGYTEAPEWVTDLTQSFIDLGMSMSQFMADGFWLVFDLGEMLITAIDKVAASVFESFKSLGKRIAAAIRGEVEDDILPTVNITDYTSTEDIRQNAELYDSLWEQYRSELPWHQKSIPFLAPGYNAPGGFKEYLENWLEGGLQLDELRDGIIDVQDKFGSVIPDLDHLEESLGELGKVINLTVDELDEMVRMVHAEAGGESFEGKIGAAAVMVNRVLSELFPNNVHDVLHAVTASGAFEFSPLGDGRFYQDINDAAYEVARQAVLLALAGIDPSGGALFFHNPTIAPGAWASKNRPFATSIGNHDFYFSDGTPFTGWGALDEPAGIVHKQEAVIPWNVLKKGGLAVLDFLGMPGFATGKTVNIPGLKTAQSTIGNMQDLFADLGNMLLVGLTKMFEMIGNLIETLAITFLGEEKAEEIKATFEKYRSGLQDFIHDVLDFTVADSVKKDELAETWFDKMKEAFDNLNWGSLLNSFVTSLSNGLMEAESKLIQLFGEVTRLISFTFEKAKDGTIELSLDWEYMVSQMANSLFTMLGDAIGNLFGGTYADSLSQRQDPFPKIEEITKNVANWEKNQARLKKLEKDSSLATIGGAGVGAGIGVAIGSLFGPLGALIGGVVGGWFGGKGGKAVHETFNLKEIEELTEKLKHDWLSIKELLGTTIQDVANSLAGAFSADTFTGFIDQFSLSLENQTRNALITGFMSGEIMRPLLDQMSDLMSVVVLDGGFTIDTREQFDDIFGKMTSVSEPFFESLQELGIATGDVANRMGQLNQAMRNVPSGLKIVSNRLGAVASVSGMSAVGGSSGSTREGDIIVRIEGDVYGIDDLDRKIEMAVGKARRRNKLATHGVS